jgi:hypothetical protein
MVAFLRITLTATALVALLAAVAVPAGAAPRPERASGQVVAQQEAAEEPADDAALAVFADIEKGWTAGNVDLILRHFGPGKVAISVDGAGPPGGAFSKNQGHYLFQDLFRATTTRRFEFVQFRRVEESAQFYAIAERHYLQKDDGRLIKDKVYVSLHLDRDKNREKWVVDEISSFR